MFVYKRLLENRKIQKSKIMPKNSSRGSMNPILSEVELNYSFIHLVIIKLFF